MSNKLAHNLKALPVFADARVCAMLWSLRTDYSNDLHTACALLQRVVAQPDLLAELEHLVRRAHDTVVPVCRECNDTGVIETGNNDLPCRCPAGDTAIFNTTYGQKTGAETGAEIKAGR